MHTTYTFTVQGRVQGVGFRYATRGRARSLGVVGWVRNCTNGAVEGVIQGDRAVLESMMAWLQSGPPGASVVAADFEELEADEAENHDYDGFAIVR